MFEYHVLPALISCNFQHSFCVRKSLSRTHCCYLLPQRKSYYLSNLGRDPLKPVLLLLSLIAVLLPLKLLSVNTSVVMSPKFAVEEFVEVELVLVGYAVPDRELATLIRSKPESKNKFAQDDFLSIERGITEG